MSENPHYYLHPNGRHDGGPDAEWIGPFRSAGEVCEYAEGRPQNHGQIYGPYSDDSAFNNDRVPLDEVVNPTSIAPRWCSKKGRWLLSVADR